MTKFVFLGFLAVIALNFNGSAQSRTEFLDASMNPLEAGVPYSYQRIISRQEDGYYQVVVRFRSGQPQMEGIYSDDIPLTQEGHFRFFFANGHPESEGDYHLGYKIGTWKRWDWEGRPKADRNYPEEVSLELAAGMIPAEFPGGDESMTRYLTENMEYPREALRAAVSGTVYVAFTINSEGYISQSEVVQGVQFFLDKEACRLVNEMPRWIPAHKSGIGVDSKFILPVVFELPGEAKAMTVPASEQR